MPDLYTETKELVEFRKLLEEDDLPEEAIKDTLEAASGAFEQTVIAVYQATDELGYDVETLNSMIKTLQSRKKALENRQENVRRGVLDAMLTSGITTISCPYFTLTAAKTTPSVIIDNEDELPDEYVELKTEIKPDKNAIKKALKDGEDVPGAHLSEAGKTLRITRGK